MNIYLILNTLIFIELIYTLYTQLRTGVFFSKNNIQRSFFITGCSLVFIIYNYFQYDQGNYVLSSNIIPNYYLDLLYLNENSSLLSSWWSLTSVLNIEFLGINSINIIFLILTSLLVLLCVVYNSEIHIYNINYINNLFIVLEMFLLLLFSVSDILLFFIFFEATLIPLVIIINVWGSRQRKIHSMYYLFIYTLVGSIFFLIGLLKLNIILGSFNINLIQSQVINFYDQIILFLCFFISFSIKVPLWPFHIWLPEAHVESPTTGSVLLAGVLLKIGTYGMLRYLIPMTYNVLNFLVPIVYTLCIVGIVYCSLIILRLIDLKKIIAYSSVIHMNVLVIGLFSLNYEGTGGSLFMMLNHGIVSSGLFLVIGSLYDRYHTRIIFYYRGLSKYMPYMNIVFIVLTLANIGLPGTSSFVSELLLLLGIGKISTFLAFVVCSTCITSAVYGLWLYSRIMLGVISTKPVYLNYFYDYNERELLTFLPIVSFILIFGLVPDTFYTFTHQENLNSYINFIN